VYFIVSPFINGICNILLLKSQYKIILFYNGYLSRYGSLARAGFLCIRGSLPWSGYLYFDGSFGVFGYLTSNGSLLLDAHILWDG